MSRRKFLERLAALVGVGLSAGGAQARIPQRDSAQGPEHAPGGAQERIAQRDGADAAAPAETTVQHAAPRNVELQRSPVAGFQYHQGEWVWPLLAVGAALTLVREPDNPYDRRAVRLDWHGRKLGYVPRIDNAAVSHLLDAGHALQARIVALRASHDPWERVEIAIWFMDRGSATG